MPRGARIKDKKFTYHIIIRSISEVILFRVDDDKKIYLSIMRRYQKLYGFKVLSYCLMSNHAHFIIDANGSDISKVMHDIDFVYAQKYNKKYNRHGHLFQDRFKSKVVNNNNYLCTLTAYIHNNPKKINQYKNNPEKYPFSSYRIYINKIKDPYGIVDYNYIDVFYNSIFMNTANYYFKYVNESQEEFCESDYIKNEGELENQGTIYYNKKVIIPRIFSSEEIITYLAKILNCNVSMIYIKNSNKTTEIRAITVFFMRKFANLSCGEICRVLGNISQGRVSGLCSMGLNIMINDPKYEHLVSDFMNCS